ncbi:trichohyalin-like [Macrosteles quadrilineatus]|uniref:trichohyalin-like n=1 Tax=Macrosteles quadrilineatus TaxID=74068 RepID=UPI0023E2DE33|nr:trichohyalin-like [Macrosteles quadrilineatus]
MRKQSMYSPKQDVYEPPRFQPCLHRFFRTELVQRECLTPEQYVDMLSTPKAHPWLEAVQEYNEKHSKNSKKKKYKRGEEEVPSQELRCIDFSFAEEFINDMWNVMSPEVADRLIDLLVSEFGMTVDEAEDFIDCKSTVGKPTPCVKKQSKAITNLGPKHKWVKKFSDVFASRIEQYIVSLLMTKKTTRIKRIAERVLNDICNVTGDTTSLQYPKTKRERTLTLIATRLAFWFEEIVNDLDKPKEDKPSVSEEEDDDEKEMPEEEKESEEESAKEDEKESIEDETEINEAEESVDEKTTYGKSKTKEDSKTEKDKLPVAEEDTKIKDEELPQEEDQTIGKVPDEENPAEEKPAENKPVEDKPAEDKPVEDKPAEDKPVEDKPVEDKPAEDKPVEDNPTEDKPAEDKPVEDKPIEDKPIEDKPAEDKPAGHYPVEDKPAEDKSEEMAKPQENENPPEEKEQPKEEEQAKEEVTEEIPVKEEEGKVEKSETVLEKQKPPEEVLAPQEDKPAIKEAEQSEVVESVAEETVPPEIEPVKEEAEDKTSVKEVEDMKASEDKVVPKEKSDEKLPEEKHVPQEEPERKSVSEKQSEKSLPILEPTKSPISTVHKPALPAFEATLKTGSTLHIQKLSSGTVVKQTAEARGVDVPPPRRVPESGSPLNLKSTEEWVDWANSIASVGEEWGKWLDSRLTEGEKQLVDKRKHSDWKAWLDQTRTEALKWRVEKERIKDEGKRWDRKLDQQTKKGQKFKQNIKNMTVTFSKTNVLNEESLKKDKKKTKPPTTMENTADRLEKNKKNTTKDSKNPGSEMETNKARGIGKVKKITKKMKKKAEIRKKKLAAQLFVTDTYDPCVHKHFKPESIEREFLTRQQYLEMLATPRGYRWAGEVDRDNPELAINKLKKRRAKRKRDNFVQSQAGDGEEKETFCDIVTPETTGILINFLVNEFGMSFEEAQDFIDSVQQICDIKQPSPQLKKTKQNMAKYKWTKEYCEMFSNLLEKYLKAMLTKRRTSRIKKITEVIVDRVCDLTKEKIKVERPKKKSHKIIVHIADRLALWIDDVYKTEWKRKTPEEGIHESELEEEEETKEPIEEKEPENKKEKEPEKKEEKQPEKKEEKKPEKKEEKKPEKKPDKKEEKEPEKKEEKEPEKKEEKEPEKKEEKEREKKEEKEPEKKEEKEPEKKEEKEPEKKEEKEPETKEEKEPEKKEENEPEKKEEKEPEKKEENEPEKKEEKEPETKEEKEPEEKEEKEPEKNEEKEPEKEEEKEPEKKEETDPEKKEETEPEKKEEKEPERIDENEPEKEEDKDPENKDEIEKPEELKETLEEEEEEDGKLSQEPVETKEGEEDVEKKEDKKVLIEEQATNVDEQLPKHDKKSLIEQEIILDEKHVEDKSPEEIKQKTLDEKQIHEVLPPRKSPGFAFEVKPKTESKLQVQKLSSSTVAGVTAKVRGVEAPPRRRKVPDTESPLNLKSAEDWADWAENIANTAKEWGNWLESRLTEAEKQISDLRRSKTHWQAWRDEGQTEALKWRVEESRMKEEGKIWNKKIDEKLKNKSETEIRTTEYHN